MAGPTFFMWGPLQFQVWPLNFHEYDHITGTTFARKEVVEAPPQREWVGEDDEEIQMRGSMFPYHKSGNYGQLIAFDNMRLAGIANLMIRGGGQGVPLGWYVCEHLVRHHRHIAGAGVGMQIDFDARFARCDTPDPANYYFNLTSVPT